MGKRVLVVEDNHLNLYLLTFLLEREGYEIRSAEDGEQAIQAIQAEIPDLIVMDMQLPKIDGYEVTRHLKSRRDSAGVPVIAITAHAAPGDSQRALEAGCDAFLIKPVNPNGLTALVGELLNA